MSERLGEAIRRAKSLMRQGYKAYYAICMASDETGVSKSDIGRAMSANRRRKPKPKPKSAVPPEYSDAQEYCYECSYPIERGDETCGLCGRDIRWKWK